MKSYLSRLFFALIIFHLPLFAGCSQDFPKRPSPKAVKGVLDLTDWDFKRDGPVDLTGEYEFYWQQHLEPPEFSKTTPPQKTGFFKVPGYWNGYEVGRKKLSGDGYATYRLKILLHDQMEPLALKFLSMGTAFTAYVNGKRVSSVGVAGKNRETTAPRYFPQVVDIDIETDQMEIIFQVSNFHHRRGGAWEVTRLGREKEIRKIRERRLSFDLFLFGSIFIIALYHLGLFILRKEDRSPLFFSIFCFLIALRLLTTGERYYIHLLPNTGWELMVKFEYLSFYLAVPVFTLFMQSLFREFSKRFLRVIVVLGSAFSCSVLFTPAKIFSHTLLSYEIITLIIFIYGIYVLIVSLTRKRDGAFVFLLGFIVLSLTTINDMLHVEKIIQTGYFAPFGLFIFIFSQAFLLSLRFSKAFTTIEVQYKDLRDTLQAYRREIIDRVRAEEALKESHERFLTVLDSIDANVYVADMDTYKVLFMNKHMRDSFGHDLIGRICWKVFRNGPGPCSQCTNDKLLDAEGKPSGVYVWGEKNPITEKWYMNYDRAVKWVNDRFVRLQVATDVTELKLTEEDLRRSEEKYRTILHSIENGYYEVDLAGNLTFFNDSLCRILGYSRDELMGMNNRQYMSEKTAKEVYQTFNEVYRTGEAAKAFDWETIGKDGTKSFLETSISLMRDSRGEPIGFRGVLHDITERKQAEEKAKLHQQQLAQASKMVALGTLVSGMAHEINNPNNFIMLNSPLLKESWESAMPILEEYYEENGDFILGGMKYTEMRENLPKLFSGILDGAKRIKEIVEDLKNFVREAPSDLTQSVDINDVLKSAISLLSNMIKKSTNHFSIEYGNNLPVLKGHFQRLEQVMINLIQNACQALPDTGKGVFVSTSCDEEMRSIVIKIQDEGEGIPSETLPHIMDPFFTTKRDSGGIGLGLSISSRIVEEQGGTMTFNSKPGKGTKVDIILPVTQVNNTLIGGTE